MSVDPAARDDAYLARKAAPRVPVLYAFLGQSNERGQVDPGEQVSSVASVTAYPQAYASLRNPGLRYPIGPAVAFYGGQHFKTYDDLYDWGYDLQIVNHGIGSLDFIAHVAGVARDATSTNSFTGRPNSTVRYQRRAPVGGPDRGYFGDLLVANGKLFVCTTGADIYAHYSSSIIATGDTGTSFVPGDAIHIVNPNNLQTASSAPDFSGVTAVGQTVTDGGIVWTCISTSTSYLGGTYTAGTVLSSSKIGAGFDPLGILQRFLEETQRVRNVRERIAALANAQASSGSTVNTYQSAINSIATWLLNRGFTVIVGLSWYYPASTTTNYDNMTTGIGNAIAAVKAAANSYYPASRMVAGPNLYSLYGPSGSINTNAGSNGAAYFLKDTVSGTLAMDNVHVNAIGAIQGGGRWADTLKTILPQIPHL